MKELRLKSTKNAGLIQSFEVTKGGKSGDLISEKPQLGKLKVGLIATGFFEFFRMYDGLEQQIEANMQSIADALDPYCELYYPGMIQTLDQSDEAGKLFKKNNVDVVVIAEGCYCVDYLIHQALLHLPDEMPLLLYAYAAHTDIDWKGGYAGAIANSGPMGITQFACSLWKMKKHMPYEVVVGAITDAAVLDDITRWIKVRTAIRNLRFMNIGLMGHIFRGMYDFQYDKTDILGKLGPHIMDLDIKHLKNILNEIEIDDPRVIAMKDDALTNYEVADGITQEDLLRASKLGVALSQLIDRYKIDGLALLGQHFIEVECKTTTYLGLSNILKNDQAVVVTEGDVLGLIIAKVMKDLSGMNAFFGEWEEISTDMNCVALLGHGFIDPKITRKDRKLVVGCACEEWGWEGNAPGMEATFDPGPVTLCHIISHSGTWKMFISEAIVPDTPPFQVSESTVFVKPDKPVRDYYKKVITEGFSHHAMSVPAHIGKDLELFAKQLEIEIVHL